MRAHGVGEWPRGPEPTRAPHARAPFEAVRERVVAVGLNAFRARVLAAFFSPPFATARAPGVGTGRMCRRMVPARGPTVRWARSVPFDRRERGDGLSAGNSRPGRKMAATQGEKAESGSAGRTGETEALTACVCLGEASELSLVEGLGLCK